MVKFQIKVLLYKVCNTMPNNIPVNVTSYFFEWGGGGGGGGGGSLIDFVVTVSIAVDYSGYTRANAIPITFPDGNTQTTIEVNITNDQLVEGPEQFFGRIISGGGISNIDIFAPNANVNIGDNDSK